MGILNTHCRCGTYFSTSAHNHLAHPYREEEILRAISVVSQGISVADSAIPGKLAKRPEVLVTESISYADKLGKAYRGAVSSGGNPVRAVAEAGEGFQWKGEAGFLVGDVTLLGTGAYTGSRYRIWYKNEHIISWRDDKVSVTPPDLITMVSTETGEAIPNPEFYKGEGVTVLGFRAPDLWRTPKGLEVFGPKHFGYDVPYIPIEERHRRE